MYVCKTVCVHAHGLGACLIRGSQVHGMQLDDREEVDQGAVGRTGCEDGEHRGGK